MNCSLPFEVIYAPNIISAGKPFSLTLRINAPASLKIDSPIVKPFCDTSLLFSEKGIFSIKLICDRIINDFSFNIKSENHSESVKIERCLEKPYEDNVSMYFEEPDDVPLLSADVSALKLEAAKMRGLRKERFSLQFNETDLDDEFKNTLQYLSYMHGASYFYLQKENAFSKFLLSHTRSGKYHTPIAFISDDGNADISLEAMLPLCPNADIIPSENAAPEDYNTLCLLGKNVISQNTANDLLAFLHTGGTLICSLSPLSDEGNKLSEYIFSDKCSCVQDSYCGVPIGICPDVKCDDLIATSDSGYPLAFIRRVGLGQIFFVNAYESPEQSSVKPLYNAIISEVSANLAAEEKIFASADKEIAFTVYNQQDKARHLYLLALNNSKSHRAVLKLSKEKYIIEVPFGILLKIVAKDDLAVWSEDQNVEVLLITSNVVTLQGYGKTKIKYAKNGEVSEREVDFTSKPIQAIQI